MKTKKYHTTYQKPHESAFSLIELMTVVSIMATLTAVATPGLRIAMINAQQNAAMQNARSIAFGLRSYAQDNSGFFPGYDAEEGEEITTSNDAFRQLIPYYVDSERIFAVTRSAWGSRSDGRIKEKADRLRRGENHFAYVAGLYDTAGSEWPLVVDGTNGSGTYTSQKGEKGGCWEGRKAIVATVGGNAYVVKMEGEEERYIPKLGYKDENALDVAAYMGERAQLLDPE